MNLPRRCDRSRRKRNIFYEGIDSTEVACLTALAAKDYRARKKPYNRRWMVWEEVCLWVMDELTSEGDRLVLLDSLFLRRETFD